MPFCSFCLKSAAQRRKDYEIQLSVVLSRHRHLFCGSRTGTVPAHRIRVQVNKRKWRRVAELVSTVARFAATSSRQVDIDKCATLITITPAASTGQDRRGAEIAHTTPRRRGSWYRLTVNARLRRSYQVDCRSSTRAGNAVASFFFPPLLHRRVYGSFATTVMPGGLPFAGRRRSN